MQELLKHYGCTVITTIVTSIMLVVMIWGLNASGQVDRRASNGMNKKLEAAQEKTFSNNTKDSTITDTSLKNTMSKEAPSFTILADLKAMNAYRVNGELIVKKKDSPTGIKTARVTKVEKLGFGNDSKSLDVSADVIKKDNSQYLSFNEEGFYQLTIVITGVNGTTATRTARIGVNRP